MWAPLADDPTTKRSVGPYRIEKILGRGGMGIVYEGIAPDGTAVAVKVVRDPNEEMLLRFEREARIRIEHPNVVRIVGAGTDADGSPYIAFELLRGQSLRVQMRRARLTPAEAVDLGIQVCQGLTAAHAAGIIHRDLKPANIFRCEDGTYKVLDFGLALRASADTQLITLDRAGMGTPSYLSPEQARGDRDIDLRSDLWSLGVVLYEALSGKRPFERDAALGTMLAIVLEDPEALSTARPDVPKELGAIVDRCLAKARDKRWDSARALETALASASLEAPELSQVLDEVAAQVIRIDMPTMATAPTRTVMESRSIPAGEQRVVAVVLANGVHDIERFSASIRRRSGIVIPLLGLRAIGLFGAERWEGDEVFRATAAALEARKTCGTISVASGRAARSGQGIAGDVVRSAEAGCMAGLHGVAIDADLARSLEDRFVVREAQEGLAEVVGEELDDSRSVARIAKSPTLGRDLDIARIAKSFETVLDERRARVALVSGPLGIGKSRVLRDAVSRFDVVGEVTVMQARGEPHLRESSHTLVAALLHSRARAGALMRGWARLDPDVSLVARQQAVLDMAGDAIDDGPRAIECAEFLGEILGVAMPDSPSLLAARADVRLMNDRRSLALQEYFTGLAERGPLALAIEDLQWGDAASLDLLDEVVAKLAEAPLFVVATTRPWLLEERPATFSSVEIDLLELKGLGLRDVGALSRVVAGRPLPEPIVKTIAERTGGNPLFVEQIVRQLRDDRSLAGDLSSLPLPVTVEAAVQSRLDHLPAPEKDLCKRAAVFGRPFTVEEITALGVQRAEQLLQSLLQRDLVLGRARARGAKGREYHFRSTLVADVAYNMLAEGVRDDLHRRAAAHLATNPDASLEERATHHEKGGETSAAAECFASAALDAMRRGDGHAALRCADRALALGAPAATQFGLHLAKADALRFLGRRAEQAEELEKAAACAADDASLARALAEKATLLWRTGKNAESIEVGARALEAARRSGDVEVRALACDRYGAALLYAGRPSEAAEVLREVDALAASAMPAMRASVADLRAQIAAAQGDLGGAREGFREALEAYTAVGDIRRAANAEANLADADNRVGAYGDASRALRAAIEKCRRVGNRLGEGYALANLGYSLTMLGDVDGALAALDESATIGRGASDTRLLGAVRVYRARAVLARAPSADAVADAEGAATEAEGLGLAGLAVIALTTAARGHLALGDVPAALSRSERALALRDSLGSVEEDEAEVFLARADALAQSGQHEDAEAVLARGRARVLEIAARIADPTRRARFVTDVAAHKRLVPTPG